MGAALGLRYCHDPDTAQRIGEAMVHGDLPRVLILAGQAVEAGCARGSLAWRAAAAVVADVSGRRAAWLAEEAGQAP